MYISVEAILLRVVYRYRMFFHSTCLFHPRKPHNIATTSPNPSHSSRPLLGDVYFIFVQSLQYIAKTPRGAPHSISSRTATCRNAGRNEITLRLRQFIGMSANHK